MCDSFLKASPISPDNSNFYYTDNAGASCRNTLGRTQVKNQKHPDHLTTKTQICKQISET